MTAVRFYFDPVCPFCWLTSKWLRTVAPQRDLTVDWRFISLRLLNAHVVDVNVVRATNRKIG